ncbi:MAG TPA: DUF2130 domain-containing protein [Tepidisphaeraceae bacterium]|nr:DUF2130 domain-containing protein [Tepidisphaeraceae bacterium]
MNDSGKIRCPSCATDFVLTDAIAGPYMESVRLEFQNKFNTDRAKLDELQRKLKAETESIEQQKNQIEETIKSKLQLERVKVIEEEKKKAGEEMRGQFEQIQKQLVEERTKREASQKAELELRGMKDAIELKEKEMDLLLARARDEAKESAQKSKDDEFRLKEADKNKVIDDLKKKLDEALRRAEQGSQQTQGEVLELDLQNTLAINFVHDRITEVPKGFQGGDALQFVCNDHRQDCGVIFWEFKRTKTWQDAWLEKARTDRLAAKAQAAVIVTTAPPAKEFLGLARINDIWVASPSFVVPVAMLLRQGLIGAAQVRRNFEGKADKQSELYDYIAGPEFSSRIKYLIETFVMMKNDLDTERRSMEKIWKAREKQIEKIICNSSQLAGELAGIVGRDAPALPSLDLKALADRMEVE